MEGRLEALICLHWVSCPVTISDIFFSLSLSLFFVTSSSYSHFILIRFSMQCVFGSFIGRRARREEKVNFVFIFSDSLEAPPFEIPERHGANRMRKRELVKCLAHTA